MKKFLNLLAAAVVFCLVVPVAGAQEDVSFSKSSYVGLEAGYYHSKVCGLAAKGGLHSGSCDPNGVVYRLVNGWSSHENFVAEVGLSYAEGGRWDVSGTGSGRTGVPIPLSGSVTSGNYAALDASLIGVLPFGDSFAVYGRGGVAYVRHWLIGLASGSVGTFGDSSFDSDSVSIDENYDGVTFIGGVGMKYDFTDSFGVKMDVIHYGGDSQLSALMLGAVYRY